MKKTFLLIGLASLAFSTMAQDNLLAGLKVFTLGDAKTWTYQDQTEHFNVEDLKKITQEPANTSNVFLYPEKGDLSADPTNQNVIGIQGFYIDLGDSHSIGTVTTTWEGAAADSYVIYVTETEPTIKILEEEPDYSITGLGQYTSHTAALTSAPKGRYLVFQPTKATNYGWGVKIRSISATAPADDILTSFKVSPSILLTGVETELTFTALNQFGLEITDQITVSCEGEGDYDYANGKITINSGKAVIFTAQLGDKELTATAYVATQPSIPSVADIKTPIFTNGAPGYNSEAGWATGYNGGAKNNGTITFADGTVAQSFSDTRCVFFFNSETTGAWNGNIFPSELGYRTLHLEVFGSSDSEFTIEFEGVEELEGGHTYKYNLKPGEWTAVDVDIEGATRLNNLSIRFTEENMSDILLSNIYFSPTDEWEAPVATTVTLSTEDFTDILIGESVKFTSQIFDQNGEEIKGLTATIEGEDVVDGIFTAYHLGKYEVVARYEDITSEPIIVNVAGSDDNKFYPVYYKTSFDGTEIENPKFPFAGYDEKIIHEWKQEDMSKGFVIELMDEDGISRSADLDLILIHWEASCPKDYTVELEDINRAKQTVEFNDKELVRGTNPIDRIAAETLDAPPANGRARMNQAQTASNLSNIHKITIIPTSMPQEAMDNNWTTQLYGLSLYGTAGDGLVTNVAEIPAIEKASAQYYTIQGVKVANPQKGLYIKVEGGKATKVLIR